MSIEIVPIVTMKQAEELAKVAEKIYYDYYVDLIGKENVKCMLDEYQNSVIDQIKSRKHLYFAIYCDNTFCGYFDEIFEGRRIILDKIYVSNEFRRRGIARHVINHIVNLARPININKIIVDIFAKNKGAIDAYIRLGFVKTKSFEMELSNGYRSEYLEMEKRIK